MVELDTGNVGSKPGWVRLNFNYFLPEEEFQYIVDCVVWIAKNGWKMLKEYHFDDDHALWVHNLAKNNRLNGIGNFIEAKPIVKRGSDRKKRKARKQYFKIANDIANSCEKDWTNKKLQGYKYNQVDNPLRWYALADDV